MGKTGFGNKHVYHRSKDPASLTHLVSDFKCPIYLFWGFKERIGRPAFCAIHHIRYSIFKVEL